MAEVATTIDEQIKLLKDRGMNIEDEVKARENLMDIGYFRLGFYWFPFEKTYPKKTKEITTLKKVQSLTMQSNYTTLTLI